MEDENNFDIHATLKELNRLWAEKLNKQEQFAKVDNIIALLKSAIVNDYSFLLVSRLAYEDILPIAGKYSEELTAIGNEKNAVVKNQQYEQAARLRDKEKVIITKIIEEALGGEHFKMVDGAQKKILFMESKQNIDLLVPDERKRF